MQASMFFAVLREGRTLYRREKALLMLDLCDVATVPLSIKNHETFKEEFKRRLGDGDGKRKALPMDHENTHQLAAAMASQVLPFLKGRS